MSDYIVIGAFWLVPFLAIGAYLFTRRLVLTSRSVLVFDAAVLLFVALLCVGLWWREITGHISTDIWLDECGFMPILVPMWTSIISVPLLIVAAFVRGIVFSAAQGDVTRKT